MNKYKKLKIEIKYINMLLNIFVQNDYNQLNL